MDNTTTYLQLIEHKRPTQVRLRLRIPKKYHQDPILSQLASRHNLDINFHAAVLGANANGDGWFDVSLRGTSEQIVNGFLYLNELDVEVLHRSLDEVDGW
jgi:hypothetical protein